MTVICTSSSTMTQGHYNLLERVQDGICHYGIQVQGWGEEVYIEDISTQRQEVEELLQHMEDGGVTPTTVRDIVDDWLGC